MADEVILAPIYAARGQPIEGVSAENIVDLMKQSGFANVRYAPDMNSLPEELAGSLKAGDMVLVLGAGDIREVSERLAELLQGRRG